MAIFERFIKRPDEERRTTLLAWVRQEVMPDLKENLEGDKLQYAEDADAIAGFYTQLANSLKADASKNGKNEDIQAAQVRAFITEDRLRAYVCLLPPRNGGADIDQEELLRNLRYAGVTSGIFVDKLAKAAATKRYLHFLPAARGTPPTEGKEGAMKEIFVHADTPKLEVADDVAIDFKDMSYIQPIHRGDAICQVTPAVQGKSGVDVTGRALPCQKIQEIDLPMGENTELVGNSRLVASIDGILIYKDGRYCVCQQAMYSGSLTSPKDNVSVSGDVFIAGDLSGGVAVDASGNIIIGGTVRDARVTSTGGSIRVHGGVAGVADSTFLTAAQQVQASSMEMAYVQAGGSIFSNAILDCQVISGRTVSVMGEPGLLVGGSIQAEKRVQCVKLGNLSGKTTRVNVGCSPQLVLEWEQIKKELDETSQVMDKLWENVTNLKKQGKLSDDQKDLMEKLVEQRNLYDAKRNALRADRDALRQKLKAATSGRVTCQELYPVVDVRIGEHHAEYRNQEKNCNIRLNESNIVLR